MARYKGSQPIAGSFASITEAQLAALNSGITATKVEDIVDKSNTQTISGAKTFSSPLTVSNTLSVNNNINSSKTTNTYLSGNQGNAIINSSASPGSYTMLSKMNTTNGYMTQGTYQGKYLLQYTDKATVDAGTNGVTKSVTLLDESGNSSFPGTVNAPTFNGTATRALWADLAEKYETDKEYPIGTLVRFGGEKEVTIAKDGICHAVISENPAYLMNSEGQGQPIALAGRVKLRIVGPVKKGQPIYLHDFIEGVGIVVEENSEKIIARALEDSDSNEEKLILCVVHFRL